MGDLHSLCCLMREQGDCRSREGKLDTNTNIRTLLPYMGKYGKWKGRGTSRKYYEIFGFIAFLTIYFCPSAPL